MTEKSFKSWLDGGTTAYPYAGMFPDKDVFDDFEEFKDLDQFYYQPHDKGCMYDFYIGAKLARANHYRLGAEYFYHYYKRCADAIPP